MWRIHGNLVRVHRRLALPAQEHGGAVLVVEGDQDGGRHVQGLTGHLFQIIATVQSQEPLRLSTEASHE